jgi:hypothetical protein
MTFDLLTNAYYLFYIFQNESGGNNIIKQTFLWIAIRLNTLKTSLIKNFDFLQNSIFKKTFLKWKKLTP